MTRFLFFYSFHAQVRSADGAVAEVLEVYTQHGRPRRRQAVAGIKADINKNVQVGTEKLVVDIVNGVERRWTVAHTVLQVYAEGPALPPNKVDLHAAIECP